MPQQKVCPIERALHIALYGLGSAGAVCFALIAYLESLT